MVDFTTEIETLLKKDGKLYDNVHHTYVFTQDFLF